MKVVIIGATGKIGEEVAHALEPRHEVIRVGSRRGDFQADYADKKSVQELFEAVSNFDALVSVAFSATFLIQRASRRGRSTLP